MKKLFGEQDVTFSRNVVQLGDWVAQGKFPIALGGVDCPDLALKGLPVKQVFLEGLTAVGAGNDPASMLTSAPHPNASKVFLNWLLSRDGQMAFQKLTKQNSLPCRHSQRGHRRSQTDARSQEAILIYRLGRAQQENRRVRAVARIVGEKK